MDSNFSGRYALANPGEGITGFCINGDVNLFGGKSIINTTFRECFPTIMDEPTQIVKPKTDAAWWRNLLIGAVATIALAAVAVACVASCGVLAVAFAGAAVAACAVTTAVAVSDYGKGGRDTWTFLGQLVMGSMAGFVAGASIAMAWVALPAAASAVGLQSAMWFGTSTFTAIVVPQIATYAGYAIIGTSGLIALNQAVETGSGRNFICEYVFGGDTDSYELFTNVVDAMLGGMTDLGNDNSALVSSSSSDDDTTTSKPTTGISDADDDSPGGSGTVKPTQTGDDDGPGGSGAVKPTQTGDDDGPGGSGAVKPTQIGDDDGPGGSGTVKPTQTGDDDPNGFNKSPQLGNDDAQEDGRPVQQTNEIPDEAVSPENVVKNSTAIEDGVEDNSSSSQTSEGKKTSSENEGVYLNQESTNSSMKNIDDFMNGNKSFDDVLDDYAKIYADNINSNKPWKWDESIPGGENLTKKQRSMIKQQAIAANLIPNIKVNKVDGMRYGFADFESAGVVKETVYLPENMWKLSDDEQFAWLNKQIGGAVDGYTWHHTEVPGKMQLVPTGIHNITTHNGGRTSGMWADAPR